MTEESTEDPDGERIRASGATIGKVAQIAGDCPNFFNFDWCQDKCVLYRLCDDIEVAHDVSKLSPKKLVDWFLGLLRRIFG